MSDAEASSDDLRSSGSSASSSPASNPRSRRRSRSINLKALKRGFSFGTGSGGSGSSTQSPPSKEVRRSKIERPLPQRAATSSSLDTVDDSLSPPAQSPKRVISADAPSHDDRRRSRGATISTVPRPTAPKSMEEAEELIKKAMVDWRQTKAKTPTPERRGVRLSSTSDSNVQEVGLVKDVSPAVSGDAGTSTKKHKRTRSRSAIVGSKDEEDIEVEEADRSVKRTRSEGEADEEEEARSPGGRGEGGLPQDDDTKSGHDVSLEGSGGKRKRRLTVTLFKFRSPNSTPEGEGTHPPSASPMMGKDRKKLFSKKTDSRSPSTISVGRKSRKKLYKLLAAIDEEQATLERELRELEQNQERGLKESDTLTEEAERETAIVFKLIADVEHLEKENTRMQEEVEEMQEANKERLQEVELLEKKMIPKVERLSNIEGDLSRKLRHSLAQQDRMSRQLAEIRHDRDQIVAAREKCSKIADALEQECAQLEKKIERHHSTIEADKATKAETEEVLQGLEEDMKILDQIIHELEVSDTQLRTEIVIVQRQNRHQQAVNVALKRELGEANAQLAIQKALLRQYEEMGSDDDDDVILEGDDDLNSYGILPPPPPPPDGGPDAPPPPTAPMRWNLLANIPNYVAERKKTRPVSAGEVETNADIVDVFTRALQSKEFDEDDDDDDGDDDDWDDDDW